MAVSLNPSTFVETGLLDDTDVEITDAAFCIWNYQGKSDNVLALGVEMMEINPGPDGQRKKHEQYYSAGDLTYFRPSADGATMEPVSDRTAMNANTNAALFLQSVMKAGFPASQFDAGSCKVLKGLRVHVNRVAQPKRPGLTKPTADGEREKQILLVSRILNAGAGAGANPNPSSSHPFGGGGGGMSMQQPSQTQVVMPPTPSPAAPAAFGSTNASAPAGATVPVPAPGPNNAIRDLAQATLINILIANGGSIPKSKLPGEAFRALMGNPSQGAVVSTVFDDGFLSSCQGVRYDGSTVTIA